MDRGFLYGVHSFQTILAEKDAERLHQLGHSAHLRVIGEHLKRHEMYREQQALQYLRQYKILAFVDVTNTKDVRHISQHLRELADVWIDGNQEITLCIDPNFSTLHSYQYIDRPIFVLERTPSDVVSSLRLIEDAQARGANIRGYFCSSMEDHAHPHDVILRAVIEQAGAVV